MIRIVNDVVWYWARLCSISNVHWSIRPVVEWYVCPKQFQ